MIYLLTIRSIILQFSSLVKLNLSKDPRKCNGPYMLKIRHKNLTAMASTR